MHFKLLCLLSIWKLQLFAIFVVYSELPRLQVSSLSLLSCLHTQCPCHSALQPHNMNPVLLNSPSISITLTSVHYKHKQTNNWSSEHSPLLRRCLTEAPLAADTASFLLSIGTRRRCRQRTQSTMTMIYCHMWFTPSYLDGRGQQQRTDYIFV